jgi:hypothetical protein
MLGRNDPQRRLPELTEERAALGIGERAVQDPERRRPRQSHHARDPAGGGDVGRVPGERLAADEDDVGLLAADELRQQRADPFALGCAIVSGGGEIRSRLEEGNGEPGDPEPGMARRERIARAGGLGRDRRQHAHGVARGGEAGQQQAARQRGTSLVRRQRRHGEDVQAAVAWHTRRARCERRSATHASTT